MAKDITLEIKSIIGEITELDSKNEQKVVALASWNGRPDTIDIRRYNVSADILTKGISLTPEEAGELIYILLASNEVKYDRDKATEIIKEQQELEVDVQKLVEALPEGQLPTHLELEEIIEDEEFVEATYGNRRRITPKTNSLFSHFYKN